MTTATQKIPSGYKQTDIGVIPVDWDVKECKELGSFYKGRGISSKDLVSDGVPCIMYGDIYVKFDTKFSNPDFRITKETATKSTLARPGDLLFTASGETVEEIGKCVVYEGKENIYIGGDIIGMTPNKDTDSIFLAYMQNSQSLLSQKANLGQGYTVVHIYTEHIKSLKIALPPTKKEQTLIASVLSSTDALITKLEALIEKKKYIKRGAIQQLLTGKKRLPGFSGKWDKKKLGAAVDHIRSGIYGMEKPADGLTPFRVATTAHITDADTWNEKTMDERYFSSDQIIRYAPKTGDLVVVKSSGIAERIKSGKLGFVSEKMSGKFIFSNFLLLLRPRIINPLFLYYYLTSYPVKSMLPNLCEASTYPNLRINEYLDIAVPYPQPKEQAAIVTILSDMDTEITALEARLNKIRWLKQGMMQVLLTGKIRLLSK